MSRVGNYVADIGARYANAKKPVSPQYSMEVVFNLLGIIRILLEKAERQERFIIKIGSREEWTKQEISIQAKQRIEEEIDQQCIDANIFKPMDNFEMGQVIQCDPLPNAVLR